jgi:hypothetical protein
MKVSGILAILFATTAFAQTPAPKPTDTPKTTEITVQSSVSEDALLSIYKDLKAKKDSLNTVLQQARASLDEKNKPIQAKIDPLQKQIQANNDEASKNFQTAVQPFQVDAARDSAQIDSIIKIVKQEQKLPDNATFDLNTGKWVVPAPAKK